MSRRVLVVAVVAILTAVAGGLWLLGRDSTLQWAVREMQARSSGKLAIANASGSLLSRVHADRVSWRGEANAIDADGIELSWSPLWLLTRTVAFDKIHANTLKIASTASKHEPFKLPEKLRLPVKLRFHDATVDTLSVVNVDGDARTFERVALSFATGPDQWTAKLAGMQTTWGTLRGRAQVGTASPFALDASLTVDPQRRAADVPPLALKADAKGNLSVFDLRVDAKVQTSTADAKLKIEPLAPQPISAIDAALHDVDVRHVLPTAPQALLDGRIKADRSGDGFLRGTVDIANRAAGTVDQHRVPVQKVTSNLVAAPERWWLEGLVIDAGRAGRMSGTGWISGGESGFVLLTDAIDLHAIHPALRATHLAGNVYASGPFDRQQIRASLADREVAFDGDIVYQPQKVTVNRARLRAGRGRFDVGGSLALDERRAFTLKTALAGFDPSQFGQLKSANISGELTAKGELAPVLHVRADGRLSNSTLFGLPVSAEGRWISRGVDDPTIGVDVKATLGQTRLALKGNVKDPKRLEALDLAIDLGGEDLQELYKIIGLPFPSTPKYRITGNLALRDKVWSLRGFRGNVGDSDLAGDFVVDTGRERPAVRAELTSQRMDMTDLGGFIGHDYHAADPAPDKLLPQQAFALDKLNAADVDLWLTGRSFRNERLPVHRLHAHLKLNDGRLTVNPLTFHAAGGSIDARVAMDARRTPIRTAVDMQVRGLQLGQLAPGVKSVVASTGTIDGRTELSMAGNSFAAMLGSADGNLVLAMNGGSMSDLVLRLADLDVAHAVTVLARGDKNIPLNCAVADFSAEDGVLRPKTLLLDSEHTVVKGEGAMNLQSEELALRLVAEPKDGSVFALRGPIRLDGTFKKPAVHPELGEALARTGAAIALGVLAPPAAILPFLQPGKQQDIDCGLLMQDATRFIQATRTPVLQTVAAAPPAADARRNN